MRCVACDTRLSEAVAFCPHCGAAQPAGQEPQGPQVVEGRRGAWAWALVALLLAERGMAWAAFPLERSYHLTAVWELPFFQIWGGGLAILAVPLLMMKKRFGGWLAILSGLALVVRASVPLIEVEPVGQAAEALAWASTLLILVFFVAGTTLTFGFLFEQSFWPVREARDFPSEDEVT